MAANDDDQRGAARIAAISALIVVASFVASKAARDAILLANFNIKTLPIFIAISAVMSLPVILLAGNLMTRYGPGRLMPALNAVSALFAVAEWLLLQRYPRLIAAVVFFHLATSGAVLVSGFWSIVNERFDVRSAKRHIGRIGIGATLGGIFGGVIAERTAVHLSPDKILLVLAGIQLTCAVTLYLSAGHARREPVVAPPAHQEGIWFGFRVVTKSQLLRNLAGVVVLGAIAAGILDYVFKADIVGASSKDGLLRSLAIFYTVTNVTTAIVQVVLCGPLIARLGVPRSVSTLPITVTVFGLFALAIPIPLAAAIARGAEAVTRNSVYRAGYELLYAPLAEEHKRPTKVVLDVGADRIGDVLGAQLVGLLVYAMAEPRFGLLIAAVTIGVMAVTLTLRLPRSYTKALEASLLARASDPALTESAAVAEPQPWITLTGLPSLGQAGDFAPLSLRIQDRSARKKPSRRERRAGAAGATGAAATGAGPPGARAPAAVAQPSEPARPRPSQNLIDAIADLRSGEPERIKRALAAELTPELAAHVVELVGRDDVAGEALAALGAIASRCTGLLVDALLDQQRDVTVRRRMPAVLLSGEPSLAAWGLWRALLDPSFDVRYRSGAVLARLAPAGHLQHIAADDVFGVVRRELLADHGLLERHRVLDDFVAAAEAHAGDDPVLQRAGTGLEHVFTVLGLVLPAEPLRIALHAVQTDDPELRGTALEYLESILPPDVRAQLWPLLEGEGRTPAAAHAPDDAALPASESSGALPIAGLPPAVQLVSLAMPRKPRSHDEIVAALRMSYPSIVEKLRQRTKPA